MTDYAVTAMVKKRKALAAIGGFTAVSGSKRTKRPLPPRARSR